MSRGAVPGATRMTVKKTVKKGGKKTVSRMTVTKAKGGYLAEHHSEGPGWEEPSKHVLPDMKSLHAHMSKHMGDEPEAEDNPAEEAREK